MYRSGFLMDYNRSWHISLCIWSLPFSFHNTPSATFFLFASALSPWFHDVLFILTYLKHLAFSGWMNMHSGWVSNGGGWELLDHLASASCLSSTCGNELFHGVLVSRAQMWYSGDDLNWAWVGQLSMSLYCWCVFCLNMQPQFRRELLEEE